MKKLILTAVMALSASVALAAPDMPLDENGWRCEGDCDRDVKCEFCNPVKKRVKKVKKSVKKSAKKSKRVKKNKKQSPARKRSRRAKTAAINEG